MSNPVEVAIQKFNPNQPRDAHGRWTAAELDEAAQQVAHAALPSNADVATKTGFRLMARSLADAAHGAAAEAAQKIKAQVKSTKVTHVKPTEGGGVEFALSHALDDDRKGHVATTVHIHPSSLDKHPGLARGLDVANRTLRTIKTPVVPNRPSGISRAYRSGPAPGWFAHQYHQKPAA